MTYRIYSDEMKAEIREGSNAFVFLEPHEKLQGHWEVNAFTPRYMDDFEDVVDAYSSLAFLQWSTFARTADHYGYQIVFMEDPAEVMEWIASLDRPTGARLNSEYPGVDEDGLLPFQRQAVNFALPLRACLLRHGTGVGKSASAIAWSVVGRDEWDACIHVVKKNNLAGLQRKFAQFADIDALVLKGAPAKRAEIHARVREALEAGKKPVVIVAYDTLANDAETLAEALTGHRVWMCWDEMPSKLRNRNTVRYRKTAGLLYTSYAKSTHKGKTRKIPYPRSGYERFEAKHLILTATPIYNAPSDLFNCIRMVAPKVLGSVDDFERKYVRGIDPWGNPIWNEYKLPLLGAEIAFMTHSVDKTDPDIAKHFPEPIRITSRVDPLPKQQMLYDILQDQYANMGHEELSELDRKDILGAISVLRMICSMPISVLHSAKEFETWLDSGADPKDRKGSEVAYKLREIVGDDSTFDTPSAKLMGLVDRLEEHREKLIVFTSMNDTVLPYLAEAMESLGVGYVLYHGKMTDKARQDAIDEYRESNDVQVLLTSDAGQDSIDLPEANHVVHYDLPWTGVVEEQRENRASRLTSKHESVTFERLICEGTYEERNEEIIDMKVGYDRSILQGKIADASRVARHDALFLMTGNRDYLE